MEKYSMRDFLTDCVRVIVVIASVVILMFGLLHVIGFVTFSERYEGETLSNISRACLITTGIVGIFVAISLIQWLIGTFSTAAAILAGFAIYEVVVFEKTNSNGILFFSNNIIALTPYRVLMIVLVSSVISFVSSLILLYLSRRNKRISTPNRNY